MHTLIECPPKSENELARQFAPIVEIMVRKYAKKGRHIDIDHLRSGANLAMLQAIRSFDPARQVSLATWIDRKVRGGILDAAREDDHLKRSHRIQLKELDRHREEFQKIHCRPMHDDDLIQVLQRLGYRRKSAARIAMESRAAKKLQFFQLENDSGEIVDAQFATFDPPTEAIQDWWEAWLRLVPEQHRFIFALYFRYGLLMREVGKALGVSESLASKSLSIVIKKLRAARTCDSLKEPPQ